MSDNACPRPNGPPISRRKLVLSLLAAVGAGGVGGSTPLPRQSRGVMNAGQRVNSGAAILAASDFAAIANLRIGLITNHTGLVGRAHLADLMHRSSAVKLRAILAPEHGFRGVAEAGHRVKGGVDGKTGVRVFSLYGATRKPTPAMLRGLDLLVFDIQDIGVRYYTYISTMGLAMQAAAKAGIPFLVLDRPNPLGGTDVAGFVLRTRQQSFVGQYRIPMVHGLTIAELASLIKGAALLPGLERLELRVMLAEHWQRGMRWPETGRSWINTSPNIVSFETALVYAGVGLFEATSASDGRGTRTPFTLLGAPWVDASRLAEELAARQLPGVRFTPVTFTPRAIKSMASRPRHKGKTVRGVRIDVSDHDRYQPAETGIHLLHGFNRQARARGIDFIARPGFLAKLSGTAQLARMLASGADADDIIARWQPEVDRFRALSASHLLY